MTDPTEPGRGAPHPGAYEAGAYEAGAYEAGAYEAGAYEAGAYGAGAYGAGASETGAPYAAGFANPAAPAAARPGRRRGGRVAVVTLIVLGLIGLLGGGGALGRELTRKPTKAEQAAALAAEIASRWERLPAGAIFPAKISYFTASGATATATLAGIVPRTSCQEALEPTVFQQMRALGCTAMLRATYLDAAGTRAATVGIAVMRSPAAAQHVQSSLDPMKGGTGLYAVPVGGTLADAFGNAQRGADGAETAGPYLMLFTAGNAYGVPGIDAVDRDNLVALGSGVLAAAEKALTSHASPCAMKDIQC
jgi:hypothetical protein